MLLMDALDGEGGEGWGGLLGWGRGSSLRWFGGRGIRHAGFQTRIEGGHRGLGIVRRSLRVSGIRSGGRGSDLRRRGLSRGSHIRGCWGGVHHKVRNPKRLRNFLEFGVRGGWRFCGLGSLRLRGGALRREVA